MNLARQLCTVRSNSIGKNVYRKFRFSSVNYQSSQTSQPQVQEEKFDFEDLKVFERTERRKPKISPFMKDVFVSVYNRELLAYPEILNKEESEALDDRVAALKRTFSNPEKTKEDRVIALKGTKMYAAPVPLTNNGLAMNCTESIKYLEVISSDVTLGQEISDHWVGLEALRKGLEPEQFNQIVDDLIKGENSVVLCIKERVAERISQADFRTVAEIDHRNVWRISGEKICHKPDGYRLVLCAADGGRLKAFLVHPGASGVSHEGTFITFKKTIATPLDSVSETALAQILAGSRLHAATLCRSILKRALHSCVDYVRPRAFSGKPLSEVSTIRTTIGEALLQIYASESAEIFTAGLLDGYEEPDVELEMAMCRNFVADNGLSAMLKLLTIPALEREAECKKLLEDMRHLASRGDSLDGINTFIALSGIHHAGKMMAEEIKQIRNPLMHPSFIFKKVFANRHQERDEPKLTLYLAEHLHPTLKVPSEQLEYCVLRMKYACETLMSRHGVQVTQALPELNRLAEAATNILVMTAVLARASRSYCIGLRNAEVEMKLAACFVDNAKDKVKKLIRNIDDGEYLNLDHFKLQFGKKVLDTNTTLVEPPTARTFW
ncbi:complex I assembly factor ACAD9, mitochondrial [Plodia interpunctella]|uniref:complex I assembly factor ACAD9, mitochondrial n=1 Tax=Plodia interpunctella TaxID=58824 RepID=UPI002367844B|nr:complex I assembly factor ACAD9, mitochondrial [Plodia interpunctella]